MLQPKNGLKFRKAHKGRIPGNAKGALRSSLSAQFGL